MKFSAGTLLSLDWVLLVAAAWLAVGMAGLVFPRNFRVVSQDDPRFPGDVDVIDDRELDHSYLNDIESTPTLIRYEGGREVERVVGWDRDAWQKLTGIRDLGADLPAFKPG